MTSPVPVSISRPKPYLLKAVWPDGFESTITLMSLRDDCPCAMCKGETIMGQHFTFGIQQFKPGQNELKELVPVGNYGIQASWNDGHDSGIYSWQMFRDSFEKNRLSDEQLAELATKE